MGEPDALITCISRRLRQDGELEASLGYRAKLWTERHRDTDKQKDETNSQMYHKLH